MVLNTSVLGKLLAWGRELYCFDDEHAFDGLILAQNHIEGVQGEHGICVEGLGVRDERTLLLLAMDATWLLWLDDFFDARLTALDEHANWRELITNAIEPSTCPEIRGFSLLRSQFAAEAEDQAAYQLWVDSAIDVFGAYHQNALLSRGKRSWSYAEYMQNGETSVGVMHYVATISLLYKFNMPPRMGDARFVRLLRNLCLAMRLQNDLISVEKERSEGDRANAVMIMEEFMPYPQALAFVAEQKKGLERLLRQDRDVLGAQDPFSRVADVLLTATEILYLDRRDRYAADAPLSARLREASSSR